MAYLSLKNQIPNYYYDLSRYAYRLTKNKEDAQDLVQETFYKAFTNFDKFTLGTNVRAWLYKILYNLFCTQCRKYNSNVMVTADENNIENSPVNQNNISKVEIIDSINKLDKKHKVISLLFFLKEYTYTDIEKITELKPGTVKSRIYRSRCLLRDEIKHKINNRSFLKAV